MAPRSGISGFVGFGKETVPGVPVTPTLFLPFTDESLSEDRERVESGGIIAGRRVLDSDQWNGGMITGGGDIGLELTDTGLGLLFRQMFGGVNSSGGGPTYTHVFTPGDLDGKTLTVQVGRPGAAGAVHPFTLSGVKVTSWEMGLAAGEIATLGLSLQGMHAQWGTRQVTDGATTNADATVTSATGAFAEADIGMFVTGTGIPAGARIIAVNSATSVELSAAASATGSGVTLTIGTPLAVPAYPNVKPLKFNHGYITIDGTAVALKSVSLSGDNALATERDFIGQTWHDEALEEDLRRYEGELVGEFRDLTQVRRFRSGTEHAVVIGLAHGGHSVEFATNVRFDGAGGQIGGREILEESIPVVCVGDGTDADAITATLVNAEASI